MLARHASTFICTPVRHGSHGSATQLAQSVGTLPLTRYLIDGAHGLPDPLRRLLADLIQHPTADRPRDLPAITAADGRSATTGEEVLRRIRRDRALLRQFRRVSRQPDSATRSHARLTLATRWLHREALATALAADDVSLWTLGKRIDAHE